MESDNPNYAHLKEELHVLVEVVAPPDQARARLAAGIAEVKKMLVPPVRWPVITTHTGFTSL